jgi:hypothetical protein
MREGRWYRRTARSARPVGVAPLPGRLYTLKQKFVVAIPQLKQIGLVVCRPSQTQYLPEEYRTDDLFKDQEQPWSARAAFKKAARELGCDESEERFQEALRTVAKQKPLPPKTKKKRAWPD